MYNCHVEGLTTLEEVEREDEFAADNIRAVIKASNNKLKFVYYFHGGVEDEGGCHVFYYSYFHLGMLKGNGITDAEWKAIKETMSKDDDSQPHATYQIYVGSVWHFIPYGC